MPSCAICHREVAPNAATCPTCGARRPGERTLAAHGVRVVGAESIPPPPWWRGWRARSAAAAIASVAALGVAVALIPHAPVPACATAVVAAVLVAVRVGEVLTRRGGPCPRCRRVRVRPRGPRPTTHDLAIGDWRSLVACVACARRWTVDIGNRHGTDEEWTRWDGTIAEWAAVHEFDTAARRAEPPAVRQH